MSILHTSQNKNYSGEGFTPNSNLIIKNKKRKIKTKYEIVGGAESLQSGGGTSYIYDSAEELSKDAKFKNIQLRGNSGITRCLGSAVDAGKLCGFDYRPILYSSGATKSKVIGDTDNVVDAWNMKDVAENTKDISIIYDRERDGEITDEMFNNIPLYSFIGTGDARGVYVSKDNPNRVSRHGIINLGFTKTGKPIIYDLGKFSEGIPEKYKKEINYIAAPSNQVYFTSKEKKSVPDNKPTEIVKQTPVTTSTDYEFLPQRKSSYASDYMSLLNSIFNKA